MLTKQTILNALPNFYGTENYYHYSPIFKNFLLTDGAKYIAEACDAYWLVDLFASHLPAYKDEGFAVLYLKVKGGKATVQIEDGNGKVLKKQKIEYTDFPLDQIVLYCCPQDDQFVLMLPSEY
jgi:hypothetical protein